MNTIPKFSKFSFALFNFDSAQRNRFERLYGRILGFEKSTPSNSGGYEIYRNGDSQVLIDQGQKSQRERSHLTGFGLQLPRSQSPADREYLITSLLDRLTGWTRCELLSEETKSKLLAEQSQLLSFDIPGIISPEGLRIFFTTGEHPAKTKQRSRHPVIDHIAIFSGTKGTQSNLQAFQQMGFQETGSYIHDMGKGDPLLVRSLTHNAGQSIIRINTIQSVNLSTEQASSWDRLSRDEQKEILNSLINVPPKINHPNDSYSHLAICFSPEEFNRIAMNKYRKKVTSKRPNEKGPRGLEGKRKVTLQNPKTTRTIVRRTIKVRNNLTTEERKSIAHRLSVLKEKRSELFQNLNTKKTIRHALSDKLLRLIARSGANLELSPGSLLGQLFFYGDHLAEVTTRIGNNGANFTAKGATTAGESIKDAAHKTHPEIEIIDFDPQHKNSFQSLSEEWLHDFGFTIETIDRKVLSNPEEEIIAKGGHIIFAKQGNEIIGTCALIKKGDGIYELSKMGVTKDHQGKGIGQRLLTQLVCWAKSKNAEAIVLDTNSKLSGAISLYEKNGFQHIPLSESEYSRADIQMRLELSNQNN